MRRGWSEVSLGDVLSLDLDAVAVDPSASYGMVGVLSYGRGLFMKPTVGGADTSYKTFYRLHPGQIVLSQLFGWEGGIATVTDDYDGRYVSSQFPTFRPKPKLNEGFARWLMRNPRLWDQLRSSAKGMGDRRRTLSPDIFFAATTPLPSLMEQQRLAAHLDAIESGLTRAQRLRAEQEQQLQAALRSAFNRVEAAAEWRPMFEVAPLVRREVAVELEGVYPELGIRSFGRGTFHKPAVLGSETTKRLFEIHMGDLVFSNVFAWEGAVAVARADDHGRFGSHRFITCVCDPARVLPEFLCFYFLTNDGLAKLQRASPGGAGRNRTLGIAKLAEITVPLVSLAKQAEFTILLNLQAEVRAKAATASEQTDALLPSLLGQILNP